MAKKKAKKKKTPRDKHTNTLHSRLKIWHHEHHKMRWTLVLWNGISSWSTSSTRRVTV